MEASNYRYLIVGGAGKAGTTSLFYYLSSHPEVCGSTVKETGFFLDQDFPARSIRHFDEGLDVYNTFFSHGSADMLRVEATPSYLYSKGTPHRIALSLPDATMLFSLREPVSFLVSNFRFLKQIGALPMGRLFGDFVKDQFERMGDGHAPQSTLTLSMGRYSKFLHGYLDEIGTSRVQVVFFEDLVSNPRDVLTRVCSNVGIDPRFYDSFVFKTFNQTMTPVNPLLARWLVSCHTLANVLTYDKPRLHESLRRIKFAIKSIIRRRRSVLKEELRLPSEVACRLDDFHHQEKAALESLLGRAVPWKPFRSFRIE